MQSPGGPAEQQHWPDADSDAQPVKIITNRQVLNLLLLLRSDVSRFVAGAKRVESATEGVPAPSFHGAFVLVQYPHSANGVVARRLLGVGEFTAGACGFRPGLGRRRGLGTSKVLHPRAFPPAEGKDFVRVAVGRQVCGDADPHEPNESAAGTSSNSRAPRSELYPLEWVLDAAPSEEQWRHAEAEAAVRQFTGQERPLTQTEVGCNVPA